MIDKDKIIVKLYLKTEEQAEALVSLQKQYDEVKAENSKLRGQHAQVLAKESAQNTLKADLDMLRSQVSQLKSQNGELERALSVYESKDDDTSLREYLIEFFRSLEGDNKVYFGKKYDKNDLGNLMFLSEEISKAPLLEVSKEVHSIGFRVDETEKFLVATREAIDTLYPN